MFLFTSVVPPSIVFAAAAQHAAHLERAVVAVPRRSRPRPSSDGREQLDALVQLALVHLADRALRTRRAPGLRLRARPAGSSSRGCAPRCSTRMSSWRTTRIVARPVPHARARATCSTPRPPMRSTPPDPEPDTICRSPDERRVRDLPTLRRPRRRDTRRARARRRGTPR